MPQIMREHLTGPDTGCLAQAFHFRPYISPVDRRSVSRYKNHPSLYLFLIAVVFQQEDQGGRKGNDTVLSLQLDPDDLLL